MPDLNVTTALADLIHRMPPTRRQSLEAALFLADLEIFHRTGSGFTGGTWQRQGSWPTITDFDAALEELEEVGDILWLEDGIRWVGDQRLPLEPALEGGLALIVDLIGRTNQIELLALVGQTSPFLVEAPQGQLPFMDRPTIPSRQTSASPAAQAAFKQAELARVSDLIDQALAGNES